MPTAFRNGAILLTLIGTTVLTAWHQIGPGKDRLASLGPASGVVDATSSIGVTRQGDWIELTDEQRGFLFLGVMNLADVPDTDLAMQDSLIGSLMEAPAVLPESVELQDLPMMVTRKIPLVRHHKFVKLDDRILVVRPADRVVVAEIPRYRLLP